MFQRCQHDALGGVLVYIERNDQISYFTFVYRLFHLGRREKKGTFVSCTSECLGRGMLYKDSVSLTPLIQVFRGRPLALQPLNLVLYAR